MLNWNAERDEEEDFSRNIRAVSGGAGLIVLADGVTPVALADVPDLTPVSNANRNQLKVHGVNGWDAIKAYVQFGIRPPISSVSDTEPDVVAGRAQAGALGLTEVVTEPAAGDRQGILARRQR